MVKVAVGIILREDKVFIALRGLNQHQGNLWEFPGGKCEVSESPSKALIRELKEECNIVVQSYALFKKVSHDYGDKHVELYFYKVTEFDGDPIGKEGQEVCWALISQLHLFDFPEANQVIVEELSLPLK